MYYEDLYITHKAFWKTERRAKHYDIYMRERKDWKKWLDSVSIEEIEKLLKFIPKWDLHFRGKDPIRFYEIYNEILPIVKELEHEKLENVDFTTELIQKVQVIFDKVAQCSGLAYESTDCSKILHTILPHLIVMWDRKIRKGILGHENKKEAAVYSLEFLPRMQIELQEALNTCMEEEGLNQEEAIKYIRQRCGNETLPKLIDEHNYVIYTKTIEFRSYLEKFKEDGEITPNDYVRLTKKLSL